MCSRSKYVIPVICKYRCKCRHPGKYMRLDMLSANGTMRQSQAQEFVTSGRVFVGKIINGGNMGRKQLVNESTIIDQWSSSKKNLNDSLIIDSNKPRQIRADLIAKHLVDKFTAPQSYRFFYKAAYYLSEDEIWRIYESSHKSRITSPIKYFITCCSKRIAELE